ncbi:hypothetical protein BD626DRAFT_576137 [Schizophyllum amplum]|uniref:Uncharacterized protein n=1 Tax=Schizophyllum amplum TaxID=97359 RepID=A0A550BU25_9AGAR|nr:hypothetical protein BD626DRAFT_576137 [Auriculariopsis ampla]
MAEVLGVVSGCISVVDAPLKIFDGIKLAKDAYDKVDGNRAAREKLVKDIQADLMLLRKQMSAYAHRHFPLNARDALKKLQRELVDCKKKCEELATPSATGIFDKLWRAPRQSGIEDSLRDIKKQISRCYRSFSVFTGIRIERTVSDNSDRLDAVKTELMQIKRRLASDIKDVKQALLIILTHNGVAQSDASALLAGKMEVMLKQRLSRTLSAISSKVCSVGEGDIAMQLIYDDVSASSRRSAVLLDSGSALPRAIDIASQTTHWAARNLADVAPLQELSLRLFSSKPTQSPKTCGFDSSDACLAIAPRNLIV